MKRMFRALGHADYRLYFWSQFVSFVGTWLQFTAQSWLVYRLTGSSFMLGLIGFGSQMPMLALSVFGGVAADRLDKRKAIIVTQLLSMFQALLLGILTLSGTVKPWHIFTLAVLFGILAAFDMPLRQSFIVEMVGKNDLGNAIALNSSSFNLARMAGPALAGVFVHMLGEGLCFLLNAASFCVAILALLRISSGKGHGGIFSGQSSLGAIRGALELVRRSPPLKEPLILMSMTSLVIMPVMVLMPVVAAEILKGGSGTLGYLFSCFGAGSLSGAISLAWRSERGGLGRLVAEAAAVFGISLAVVSFSGNFFISGAALALAGAGMARQAAGCNTLLQSFVPDEFRGRVMSLFIMTFVGLAPFGSLLSGKLAQGIGIGWTLRLGGAWVMLAVLRFYRRIPEMKESSQSHPAILPENGGAV